MAVRCMEARTFSELDIVFAMESTRDHSVGIARCRSRRSRAGEADWVRSSPLGLGNEGEKASDSL
jgi:hypothetical protein